MKRISLFVSLKNMTGVEKNSKLQSLLQLSSEYISEMFECVKLVPKEHNSCFKNLICECLTLFIYCINVYLLKVITQTFVQ